MTDELRRQYNAKVAGKQVCVECRLEEIIANASMVVKTNGTPQTLDTDPRFL